MVCFISCSFRCIVIMSAASDMLFLLQYWRLPNRSVSWHWSRFFLRNLDQSSSGFQAVLWSRFYICSSKRNLVERLEHFRAKDLELATLIFFDFDRIGKEWGWTNPWFFHLLLLHHAGFMADGLKMDYACRNRFIRPVFSRTDRDACLSPILLYLHLWPGISFSIRATDVLWHLLTRFCFAEVRIWKAQQVNTSTSAYF